MYLALTQRRFTAIHQLELELAETGDERDKVRAQDMWKQTIQIYRNQLLNIGQVNSQKRLYVHTTASTNVSPSIQREISIPIIAQEMGIRLGDKSAQIGRRMVQLWRKKYNYRRNIGTS